MLVADYNTKWEYLSKEHEIKDKEVQEILDYCRDDKPLKYLAYAVLGTYGVGKTQFLYHIHRCSIEREIIPLYFLAEDLFREVIKEDRLWTSGEVYSLIENKITKIKEYLSLGDSSEVKNIIDPRGKIIRDSPEVIERVFEKFSGNVSENSKIILLVDELEGQYGNLQEIVQTKDRSPLRESLESKTHLKFLAFAPAGIYELGGADRDRVKRIVLPPADVKYVRENLIKNAGKSNASWWLSRGKARQLFKTVKVLEKLESEYFQDTAKAFRVIKGELDSIGQPPTEVPAAVTDKISPSKIPFLLKLDPITCEEGRRYIIDAEKLQTGELAERLVEAFKMSKDNAILISEYFKKTVRALSDDGWLTYIDERDLPELFCLVLDHFLEYEHGSPELSKRFGEILSLYERSKEEHAAMHGTIGTLWERREIGQGLALSVAEIRGAFPFPTMNPIVKEHVPDNMKKKWEGRDIPLWKWTEGNITILFFASARDFIAYFETDEFLTLSLPDGKGVLCLLPHGEDLKKEEKKPLFKWLEESGKLKVIPLPHLLTDFLLSASGELDTIPGNLEENLRDFREDKEDILLSRKTEIYEKAIDDTIKDGLTKPKTIYKGSPPDADTVWGRTQIGYRTIAVNGVALAFSSLKLEERLLIADLRELFKGGREGKGIGDLRYLISGRGAPGKGGHTRLPDRLLAYHAKGARIRDTECIEKLRIYWRSEEINKIEGLARILPLNNFLRLHQDEDIIRLLEALWRITRGEFDAEEEKIADLSVKLQNDIIPTLKECKELERTAGNFGSSGIDFRNYEMLVKSLPSFEKLLEILNKSRNTSPLVKSITVLLAENMEEIDSDVRELSNSNNNAKRALEELQESAENLESNFLEYKKAIKFLVLKKKDMKSVIDEQVKMDDTLELEEIEEKARERKEYLDAMSVKLAELESKLEELEEKLSQIKGGK